MMNNVIQDIGRIMQAIMGYVQRVLDYPIFPSNGIKVASLLVLALYFVLVIVAERAFRKHFIARLLGRTHLEPAMQFALARMIGYCFLGLGFYISFQMVGINLNSLAFLAGAVGVGLGFGMQNIISNFVSGLIVLAERPIAIGDRIDIGGITGQVREISLRSTTVITNDNIAIIVPNADFITQRVTNWSYGDSRVRFRIPFGVAYGTDLQRLRKLMLEVADQHPHALKDPKPELFLDNFGDSSINFELAVWSNDMIVTPRRFRSDMLYAIEEKLRENDIEIPFPQRELRFRSADGSAEAPLQIVDGGARPKL